MNSLAPSFQKRIDSLRLRIEELSSLRNTVALPPLHDISPKQWSVIESELKTSETRLLRRLKRVSRAHLPHLHNSRAARSLNSLLGEIELEMSKTFTVFDTFMDILTQRHTPELGQLLAGCDVLALSALKKDHPALALIEPPLVFCDRGFGASTLREGIRLPGRGYNPMPLIQIPYSRLQEKCNLTSIFHEAGHEAMVRLEMVKALPEAFREALRRAGAPASIRNLYALWSSEIGPDFWTFGCCGFAEAATIREILALPASYVFRVSWGDPHPPPFLRALISFDWCRQVWGSGLWDDWQQEWLALYPLKDAPSEMRSVLRQAMRYVPIIGRVLLHERFPTLNNRALIDLFHLSEVAPAELRRIAESLKQGALNLKNLSPSTQLATFRYLKEQSPPCEKKLDSVMTKWLVKLGDQKKSKKSLHQHN
jgi:hypothetical protein